jgi:hypothetical protein
MGERGSPCQSLLRCLIQFPGIPLSGGRWGQQPTNNIPPNLAKTKCFMTSIRKDQEIESKALVISNLRRLTFFCWWKKPYIFRKRCLYFLSFCGVVYAVCFRAWAPFFLIQWCTNLLRKNRSACKYYLCGLIHQFQKLWFIFLAI